MEVSEEMMDEDLRARIQNNIKLCEQYAVVMRGNVTIRMATLASQLSSGIFNAMRGEPLDVNIFNELSQLLIKDNAEDIEHASIILAFKNFVLLAELSVRIRERKTERNERAENTPAYDDYQYSTKRSPPRYLMESPKRPKHEVEEELDSIIPQFAHSESGTQSFLENNDEMEQEDTRTFEKENDDMPQIMDDARTVVENEEELMESGETTNIVVEDDRRMNRDEEKKEQSVVNKEKKVEQTPIIRNEGRKRTHSTAATNLDKGQTENTSAGSRSMKRRARTTKSYEEKDEEEDQSTNYGLSHRSSAKQAEPERVSLAIKETPVKQVSIDVKTTERTTSKNVVSSTGKMVDQVRSLAFKGGRKKRMMNSPLTKTAAAFGLKTNTLQCPFCNDFLGAGSLHSHVNLMHNNTERHLNLFGCDKCNSWCSLPGTAMNHHRETGCQLRVRSVDEAKNEIMNTPLSKTAATFGMKTNILECPFCEKPFGIGNALDKHLSVMHNAEKLQLFGCDKCNSWCKFPRGAMFHHRERGCQLRVRTVDEANDQVLSKTANSFGLKSNFLECPYCKESFGAAAMNDHLLKVHMAERQLKLFGCDNCNSWYRFPNGAMTHHRQKGCKVMIRSVDETKKWNALYQNNDDNVSEEEEEDLNEDDKKTRCRRQRFLQRLGEDTVATPIIDCNMASRLSVLASESIRAMSMTASNEQKPCATRLLRRRKEEND